MTSSVSCSVMSEDVSSLDDDSSEELEPCCSFMVTVLRLLLHGERRPCDGVICAIDIGNRVRGEKLRGIALSMLPFSQSPRRCGSKHTTIAKCRATHCRCMYLPPQLEVCCPRCSLYISPEQFAFTFKRAAHLAVGDDGYVFLLQPSNAVMQSVMASSWPT